MWQKIGLVAALILLSGCNKVTQDNYAKLKSGMAKQEVEKLLGSPTQCAGALGLTSCTWGDEQRFISVQFAGDKVLIFSGQGLK